MSPFRIDFDALQWHSPLPGARFKVYREGARQLRLVEFTSEFVEPHWCEKGHVGMVLDGVLEVDFNGRLLSFPAGSGLFIPAGKGSAHKARSVTPLVRLVLMEDADRG